MHENIPALSFAVCLTTLALQPAHAQSDFNAKCAVFRGDTFVEGAPCRRITIKQNTSDTDETAENIYRYEWQTGGTTVTVNAEEAFTINGSQGETVAVKPGYTLCVRNFATGNTFCAAFDVE